MTTDENSISAKHADEESDESFFRRMYDKAKVAMAKARFCPRCCGEPTFAFQAVGEHTTVWCEACGESKGLGSGKSPAEAVAAWNALPGSFPCAGYPECSSRVDEEEGICADCMARNERESAGGCPGCGGFCRVACR